jgi:hypothetical protein
MEVDLKRIAEMLDKVSKALETLAPNNAEVHALAGVLMVYAQKQLNLGRRTSRRTEEGIRMFLIHSPMWEQFQEMEAFLRTGEGDIGKPAEPPEELSETVAVG